MDKKNCLRIFLAMTLIGTVFSKISSAEQYSSSPFSSPPFSEDILLIPAGLQKPCSGEFQNGIHRQFYPSGQLYAETYCKDGKREGPSRILTSEGFLWAESNFRNDKLEGMARQYDKKGQLTAEIYYENDQIVGPIKGYSQKKAAPAASVAQTTTQQNSKRRDLVNLRTSIR